MELGTFGALIGFAIELEASSADFYDRAKRARPGGLAEETFARLAAQASKNKILLERTRRENVAEMILEPIAGIGREDYIADLTLANVAGIPEIISRALDLEDRAQRFYTVAAEKVSLPEVKRIFTRLAEKRAESSRAVLSLQSSS